MVRVEKNLTLFFGELIDSQYLFFPNEFAWQGKKRSVKRQNLTSTQPRVRDFWFFTLWNLIIPLFISRSYHHKTLQTGINAGLSFVLYFFSLFVWRHHFANTNALIFSIHSSRLLHSWFPLLCFCIVGNYIVSLYIITELIFPSIVIWFVRRLLHFLCSTSWMSASSLSKYW